MRLPIAQKLQLRSVGLMKQNVKLKPAGGSSLRDEIHEILGDQFQEWLDES